jgi:two-component sensor histidine kinase
MTMKNQKGQIKDLENVCETPLSNTEYQNLLKLISLIDNKTNVFIIGPNGIGKTFLIEQAKKHIKNRLCHTFDLIHLFEEGGGLAVYKDIVVKITKNELPLDEIENYISEQFFNDIKLIDQPIVLFFDNFQASNKDFYNHFSQTCRKIDSTVASLNTEDKNYSNNKCDIVMVFSGSLIISDVKELSKSPLWNITEKVYVKPHNKVEANFINSKRLYDIYQQPPEETLLAIVYNLTSGHKYLAKTVIKVIKAYDLQNESQEIILSKYMDHVWSVLSSPKKIIDNKSNQKIWFHFHNIIEYLETNANILMVVLSLFNKETVYSESPFEMDQVTITGIVDKNENGEYFFSNIIYEQLIARLFEGHRAGDYCLFHAENEDVWKRAKEIYKSLHENKIERQYSQRMKTRQKHVTALIAQQIVQRLKKHKKIQELTNEISEILTQMYGIHEWGIISFNETEKDIFNINFDKNFSQLIELSNNLERFLSKVINEKKHLIDWTGTWQGIPVIIGSNFKRIFIHKLKSGQRGWGRIIPTFIQDALTQYHNLMEHLTIDSEIKRANKALSERKSMATEIKLYRRGTQQYWDISKDILKSQVGIKKFYLHEIINNENFISTHSSQKTLTPYDNPKDINENIELKEFKESLRYAAIGKPVSRILSQKEYTGCRMNTYGNMMVIETSLAKQQYEEIKDIFVKYLKLIYIALEQNIQQYQTFKYYNMAQITLNVTQDLIFIVSRDKQIIFVNDKLKSLIDSPRLKTIKNLYNEKQINIAFESKTTIFEEIKFEVPEKNKGTQNIKITNASYVPILREDIVFAVAVVMQDVTYRSVILQAQEKMLPMQSIQTIEDELLDRFELLGFDIVFQYKKKKGNLYLAENKKGSTNDIKYKYEIDFTSSKNSKRVVVWYRKGFPINDTNDLWIKRLNTYSDFKIQEDQNWSKYDATKPNKPNFWITFPIFNDKNKQVDTFYSMGWRDEKKWDIENVNVGKLTLLNSFSITVSQIIENLKQKQFLEDFQGMISHGLKEPLQVSRFYLEPIAYENQEEREEMVNTVDAQIEMALTGLESLLTLRKVRSIDKEFINVAQVLNQQLKIFAAYARKQANIEFEIKVSDNEIVCYLNKIMLVQVLNNLVGNCVKYLKRNRKLDRQKKIQIILKKDENNVIFYISDNGNGLPEDVVHFLKQDVSASQQTAISRFGIKFSKEIAHMLDGRLELIEPPLLKTGTSYKLVFPYKQERNNNDN